MLIIFIKDYAMTRRCDLSGTGAQTGHKVSHSNRKANRRFLPNLQRVSIESEVLGVSFSLRVTIATLRCVDHNGGLDAFFLTANDRALSPFGILLKKRIRKAVAEKAA